MAKQLTIKQISELSGVSAGTVDRILHNRGKVSEESRQKVEAVLSREGYKYNIHTSAVSLKKSYVIVVLCPVVVPGGYWQQIREGISKATEEYSDIDIRIIDLPYNQYDYDSSCEVYGKVSGYDPDAVIIGGTFAELTRRLCKNLDGRSIPYVFVDAAFGDCHPVGCFTPDQKRCGRVMARMADSMIAPEGKITVLRINRSGDVHSHNTDNRMAGLMEYFRDGRRHVEQKFFTVSGWKNELADFVRELVADSGAGALIVMSSWGHHICDAMKASGIADSSGKTVVCGFDATDDNLRCLRDGSMTFILDQHPQSQGFRSLEQLIRFLLYRTTLSEKDSGSIPVNILIKEML